MLTEFLRDHAFAIAWLGLMAAAWFGWSQEDPKPRLRGWLGAGSVLSMVLAIGFGILVWRHWSDPTALEGQYWVFGFIVLAEVAVIGAGCFWLARRQATRWFGWWIGLCIALHFLPLTWVFDDWSYAALTIVQVLGLLALLPVLRRSDYPTSRWACPWIGVTFLAFGLVSSVIFLIRYGYPL